MVNISYNITSTSTILFSIDLGTNAQLPLLHFTVIVYDQVQLANSGAYRLNYTRVNWTGTENHSLPISPGYEDYVITGWTAFSSTSTSSVLFFDLFTGIVPNFSNDSNDSNDSNANQTGVYMPAYVPKNAGQATADNYSFSIFSLESIFCNTPTFYYNILL
jgi:hypothetical protein